MFLKGFFRCFKTSSSAHLQQPAPASESVPALGTNTEQLGHSSFPPSGFENSLLGLDPSGENLISPISQFKESDVFIVGYPKSGNTWFQHLAAGIVYGLVPEYAPARLAQYDLIPDIHFKKNYCRFSKTMYFKSHNLPQKEYRRIVYLLRDGRDAMVSYFHFLNALSKTSYSEMMRDPNFFPSQWHKHVTCWLDNPFSADMIVIKFEDLKEDPVRELKKFCAFANLERPGDFLKLIANSSSFQNLQKKESEMGNGIGIPGWNPEKKFFRRGEVGSYKDEMPPEDLAEFMSKSEPVLRKVGYI